MPKEKGKQTKWLCECSCEKHTRRAVSTPQLTSGRSQSCGCLAKERAREANFKDIKGQKFGELVAEEHLGFVKRNGKGRALWRCKCSCGRYKDVQQDLLQSGGVKTCGNPCHRKKPKNFIDLKGKRFGELLVLSQAPSVNEHTYWLCLCDCGNIHKVEAYKLASGKITHCRNPIHRVENLVGNTYGYLYVKEFSRRENYRTFWKCVCTYDGNEIEVDSASLKFGVTRSCGHLHKSACEGSSDELELKSIIKEFLPDIEPVKSRQLNGHREIDMFYVDKFFGIEYNGSAFHANVNGAFREVDKYLHRDKFIDAKMLGIHLVTIFDVDWLTNSGRIIKHIKGCLVSPSNIIDADICELVELDEEVSKSFCNSNYIYGYYDYIDYSFGLFYNDELISVMCFRKMATNRQCELCIYCTKEDYIVNGGYDRIHKHFEDEYYPTSIVSYSNNDYFSGNVQESLGYKEVCQIEPTYYWFLNNKEVSSEYYQLEYLKEKYLDLYEEACTENASSIEDYIMVKLHARKVYRCGNTLWEKQIN